MRVGEILASESVATQSVEDKRIAEEGQLWHTVSLEVIIVSTEEERAGWRSP